MCMRTLFILPILFGITVFADSLEVSMTLTKDEVLQNETVGRSGGEPATVSRVIQLQLLEAKCTNVIVTSLNIAPAAIYKFNIDSGNCVVKEKAGASCNPGYKAMNMPENPYAHGAGIVGGDKYKICMKSNGTSPGEPPAAQSSQ
jgi:hypothetical protein